MSWQNAQEAVALSIVGLAALGFLLRAVHVALAIPLSNWLLRRGKVKWAMRLRFGRAAGRKAFGGRKPAPKPASDCCE